MFPSRAVIASCVVVASALGAIGTMPIAGASESGTGGDAKHHYAVGLRELALEDTTRATPADPKGLANVPASRTRALPTFVYYPALGTPAGDPFTGASSDGVAQAPAAAGGRFPVILFSHGSPGTPTDYASLLERWAAEGYVVVAPTYPVSSRSGPDVVSARDQRDQVRDARFVLGRVLALSRLPVSAGGLGGLLDRTRIAAAGHSMGGLTTLALVSDCCRDRRVDAALVLAGVSVNRSGPSIDHPSGPVLFAHATYDLAVPFNHSTFAYRRAGRPKYLLEIEYRAGVAGHIVPFFPGSGVSNSIARVVDDFLAGYVGGHRAALGRIAAAASSDRFLRLRARR